MDGKNDGLDLGDMINKLMSNPEFSTLVKSMKEEGAKGDTGLSGPSSGSENDDGAKEEISVSGADIQQTLSSMGGSIPSDVMNKIPDIMSALGPIMKSGSGKAPSKSETENRNRLLLALKPYVSSGRREMIDTVLSVSKLTTLLDIIPNKKTDK